MPLADRWVRFSLGTLDAFLMGAVYGKPVRRVVKEPKTDTVHCRLRRAAAIKTAEHPDKSLATHSGEALQDHVGVGDVRQRLAMSVENLDCANAPRTQASRRCVSSWLDTGPVSRFGLSPSSPTDRWISLFLMVVDELIEGGQRIPDLQSTAFRREGL